MGRIRVGMPVCLVLLGAAIFAAADARAAVRDDRKELADTLARLRAREIDALLESGRLRYDVELLKVLERQRLARKGISTRQVPDADFAEALKAFRKAKKLAPKSVEFRLYLGLIYLEMSRADPAKKAYHQSLAKNELAAVFDLADREGGSTAQRCKSRAVDAARDLAAEGTAEIKKW